MPLRQVSLSLSAQPPPPSYQGQLSDDPHVPGYAFEPYAPSPPPSTTTHHPLSTMGLPQPHHQPKEKDKPHIMIIPDAPYLALKGTGPDVEPTTLSGNVVLYLTESTTLKEITLQFRGKARIPMPANESLINNSTYITYVVCNHDWSFLESGSSSSSSSSHKRHSRTLKAGKHYFPFSLSIGGTLPSSITTPALGGASVAYKLRAVATRPGLAHNLQTIIPVPLLRTFTPEALEYQQTLEIENTWPDKMMYAIMLPHKAWAAGDTLGAVVKFSPLGKGVRVASVVSTLWETTKMYARSGTQEDTRPVCSIRHEIVDGRAVEVDWSSNPSGSKSAGTDSGGRSKLAAFNFGIGNSRPTSAQGYRDFGYTDLSASGPSSASGSDGMTEQARRRLQREQDEEQERLLGYENHDVVACIKMPIPLSSDYSASGNASAVGTPTHTPYSAPSSASASTSHFPSLSLSSHSNHSPTSPFAGVAGSSSSSTPPVLVTPSHALEPVVVSHRLRWSIFIQNRDGHISELRCSLPVTILDGRLKEEARDASLMSRRMMVRSCPGLSDTLESDDEEVWGINRDGEDAGEGGVGSRGVAGEDGLGRGDRELPSYTAHVRDRVANMFLPEAVTVRVGNPWVVGGGSAGGSVASVPTSPAALLVENDPLSLRPALVSALSAGESGASASTIASTPGSGNEAADAHVMSHLPHAPPPTGSGASTPLDWVNSELLLSLSGDPVRRFGSGEANVGTPGTGTFSPVPGGMRTPPSVLQYVAPVPGAYGGSRWGSRVGSRANSRAASPERGGGNDHHHSGEHPEREGRSRPSSPVNAPASLGYVYEPLPSAPIGSGASSHKRATGDASSSSHESHGSGHGMRNLQSLFKATMKPFTALSLGGKHRHDDKDHHHPHHQHREGSSTSHSREGSTANSRSSSPVPDQSIHTSSTYPASSAASTYTYTADSVMNSPLPTSHDPIASPVASRVSEDQSVLTTASSSASLHANTQPQAHSSSSLGQPSMSTSELTSLRRAAISSPYAQANVQQQQQQQLQTQQQQQLSGPALLHRALTEVPDYSIASRGFIGGVAPLSSMKGLPSYQEAVGHGGQQTYGSYQTYHQGGGRRLSPLSGSENSAGEGSSHIPTNTGTNASPPPPPNGPRRSAASVPNLTSHFAQSLTVSSGSNTTPPVPPIPTYVSGAAEDEEREVGILQRLESAGAISSLGTVAGPYTAPQRQREDDEDDDDEDGNGIEMRTRSHTVTHP